MSKQRVPGTRTDLSFVGIHGSVLITWHMPCLSACSGVAKRTSLVSVGGCPA